MYAMEHAHRPASVRLVSRLLEKATGIETKDILASFNTVTVTEWYQRNGYYGIAGLGGYSSYSGKTITPDAALEAAAVYACVKILGEDMGALPFFLFRRSADRKSTVKAFEHPLYEKLHDLANPDTTAGEFVETLTAHAALTGNGFAKIARNGRGEVLALWPLMPRDVQIITDDNGLSYKVRDGKEWKPFPRKAMFHLRGFTLTGLAGDDILSRAKHVLGLTLAGQEYAGRFFAQDASAGTIIERPIEAPKLGPGAAELIKEAWKKWHQGIAKSHEPALLAEGMTAKRLDPDHQKLQLLDSRTFQILEVARLFRMPPHKIAELSRATFSNIEEQQIEYVSQALHPWRKRWRQTVHRCLLTKEERPDYFAEHNLEALLRGDFKTQSEGWARLLEKGVSSINEVRALLNLNPVDGGDKHFIQLNMQSITDAATGAAVAQGAKLVAIEAPPRVNGQEALTAGR
jgi:HK97 family phage portal protein